jgi:ABC-type transport system involved in multi-copper enzyme maturation permease subunit
VLGLIASVLPILSLAGLLGGIDPLALFSSFSTAVGCAVLGCSLALVLSVWGRKTHEVLMLTYLLLILGIVAQPLIKSVLFLIGFSSTSWFRRDSVLLSNPYYLAFAPYSRPNLVDWTTYLVFLAVCVSLSLSLVSLATWRIRCVASKRAGQGAAGRRRGWFGPRLRRPAWFPHLPGPSLDGNPVLWREWHRSKPTGFLRMAWVLYGGLGLLWVVFSLRLAPMATPNFVVLNATATMYQVSVGLLLLSVSASTSLAEERVRGSLDVLLATPLSTPSILVGKWWGAFRQVPFLLVWPAFTTFFLAVQSGHWFQYLLMLTLISSYGAVIASLGLALATWVSRLGRAVALCVAAYVLFAIGWVMFSAVLFGSQESRLMIVSLIGSPYYGTAVATVLVSRDQFHSRDEEIAAIIGAILWILINSGLAAILFAATLATFDRCLGRISETSGQPLPSPRQIPFADIGVEV